MISKILVRISPSTDISNLNTKFDNNRSSFGEYMANKNGYRQSDRQIDRQTETGYHFFGTFGVIKHREIIKVAICPMDSITIHN